MKASFVQGRFDHQYQVFPVTFMGKEELEKGNKQLVSKCSPMLRFWCPSAIFHQDDMQHHCNTLSGTILHAPQVMASPHPCSAFGLPILL